MYNCPIWEVLKSLERNADQPFHAVCCLLLVLIRMVVFFTCGRLSLLAGSYTLAKTACLVYEATGVGIDGTFLL